MTRHLFFISCALVLVLQCNGARAYSQELDRQEGPWRRDPFRYSVSTQKSAALSDPLDSSNAQQDAQQDTQQELEIKGILQRSDGSYRALINGQEVREGDQVGDVQILTISRFSAVVRGMDGTRKIDLFHNQVKWGDQ